MARLMSLCTRSCTRMKDKLSAVAVHAEVIFNIDDWQEDRIGYCCRLLCDGRCKKTKMSPSLHELKSEDSHDDSQDS